VNATYVISTLFQLGQVCATHDLIYEITEAGYDEETTVLDLLMRHASGDWGDLDKFDKLTNDAAVLSGHDRILSRYAVGETDVYVITEWDRSVTTIMRVQDY
jgi:hypothetical protein